MRQINVKALKKRAEVEGQVWQAGKTNAFCEWRSGGCKMEDGAGTQTLAFSRKQQRYLLFVENALYLRKNPGLFQKTTEVFV